MTEKVVGKIDVDALTSAQKRALVQLGILQPEEDPKSELEWSFKALIRSAAFNPDTRRYVEVIEKVECDEIAVNEIGDYIFRKTANIDKDKRTGSDLVVPRTSVLWLGRKWKPAAQVVKVPAGQYL